MVIGPVEIAAVGVSIAILNQASKVTIFPLVSITTSFVAEEEAAKRMSDKQALDDDVDLGCKKDTAGKKAALPEDNLETGSTAKDQVPDHKDGTLASYTLLNWGYVFYFNLFVKHILCFYIQKKNRK